MRILNVGDFDWATGRERDTVNIELFAVRRKLGAAATRAGHLVVEFSDRAVARIRGPLGVQGLGGGAANRVFLQFVEEVRPGLILLNFADELANATLREARQLSPGVLIAEINVDPLQDPKNRERLLRRRNAVDATFVTTAGPALKEFAGSTGFVAYMPNPVDRSVETGRAFAAETFQTDLILPVKDDEPRQIGETQTRPSELAEQIRRDAPDLRVRLPGLTPEPRLRGRAYIEALEQSRMGLALSRHNDQPLYASDRTVHMLGCGLLTFLDAKAGWDRFYTPEDVAFYTDTEDLKAQITAFAADDARRQAVARRGWRRTFDLFEGRRVLDYLMEQLAGSPKANDYGWPGERWTA